MKVWDNQAVASEWSDVASFYIAAKGVLSITSPTAGALAIPTPTITHALTTTTQEQVSVLVERLDSGVYVEAWRKPQYLSVATSHTLPDANALKDGKTYRITVRVWDTYMREDLPGDRAFNEASVVVTMSGVLV
jgi:hypothetical protein